MISGLANGDNVAYPFVLSGGEKQPITIVRAIIHQRRVLFAPASLASQRSKEIM